LKWLDRRKIAFRRGAVSVKGLVGAKTGGKKQGRSGEGTGGDSAQVESAFRRLGKEKKLTTMSQRCESWEQNPRGRGGTFDGMKT